MVHMRRAFPPPVKKNAQTLVFFLLAFGTIFLLCGFAIDSGLLYLAKARLSRAVDGAALAAVGNFHQDDNEVLNRQKVATTMRNFAAANYTDLQSIATSTTETASSTTPVVYTYTFSDGTPDPTKNPPYSRYVQVVLQTGAGGQITSATCNARCPARTYFMGYAGAFFRDMKVSSAAVATRNPRLIMIVVDRSGSMLKNGGCVGLPDAIVAFLDFFDTTSDYIGIVSFSSNARVEMPLTTNFLTAGTNVLYNSYDTNFFVPGVDNEQSNDPGQTYATSGIRRMKFGGSTAADEGIRLGLEQMMANSGFNNPNVTKYLVLFTDGAWNASRSLLAAPGYTNVVTVPVSGGTNTFTNTYDGVNPYPVPTLSPLSDMTNALADTGFVPAHHQNDTWQSSDGELEPPLAHATLVGTTTNVTTIPLVASSSPLGGKIYATTLNVWLQPGAVDYVYDAPGGAGLLGTYVSCYTNSTMTTNLYVPPGGSNVLVVPGYIADGVFTDSLDLPYPDDGSSGTAGLACYRSDNYNQQYMWPDDTQAGSPSPWVANSNMRNLAFRNYVNLLTGYYIYRADDPPETISPTTELLDDTIPPFVRPLHGLGPYYPSAGFYWPFGDSSSLVGVDQDSTYPLLNPLSGLPPAARFISFSINMLSTNAAPNWAGELFYRGTSGSSVVSGTNTVSVSTQIQSVSDWQLGEPSWFSAFSANMLDDPSHYGTGSTNIINGHVWRPTTFIGNHLSGGLGAVIPANSITGGFVTDGAGNYFRDSMAYSGRPTHYYNFATSSWVPFHHNHIYDYYPYQNGEEALPMGNWKVQEYAWHARAAGVTIYTVGYGNDVGDAEQLLLAQVANATNTTGYASTNGGANVPISFSQTQPIGQQFHASDPTNIIADFQSIAQAINAYISQ